ncbi:unnamed protein product [Ilex paraguariensis]|uniref:Putative plant transposon protein domain-containing protein n=1 Tax=Ilex paraguariensis TaxID=185542 RepID=A0ABC8TD29_9AQUA
MNNSTKLLMETKKKRKAEGKYRPKVDNTAGIWQMKNKQVGDQSCPKPPMVHSFGCPCAKQNKNVDHSSSLANLVSSSIPAFFNRNGEELYHNRFCHKPVLLDRGTQLDKMTDVDCAIIFYFRHWNSIVQIDKNDKAYDEFVRIFYANMHDVENEDLKFKSYMRNVRFQVNLDLISKILNVVSPFVVENTLTYPFKNLSDQPALADVATELYDRPFNLKIETFYQRYLTNTYRILNRIVGCNINQRGHSANFGLDRAHLLYAIRKGITIDLPHLIFNEIVSTFDVGDRQKSLPFPILISKIMMHYGVVIHPTDSYKSPMCDTPNSWGPLISHQLMECPWIPYNSISHRCVPFTRIHNLTGRVSFVREALPQNTICAINIYMTHPRSNIIP